MRTERFKINNPVFNEFLYSMLYNASFDQKRIIPPRFQKLLRQKAKAREFVRTATLDEAAALLSYLGIEHFIVFADRDKATVKALKEILKKFHADKKITALKDIIEAKIFVSSDKEFNDLLGLMAQTIHHKSYTMNLEYTRVGHHIHNWPRQLYVPEDGPTLETQENSALVAKTLLSATVTMDRVEFMFKLKPLELQILLYLYPLKHTYVAIAQLVQYFGVYHTKTRISVAVKNLGSSTHIRRSAVAGGRQYTIAALGIRVITEYMEAVLHANDFR